MQTTLRLLALAATLSAATLAQAPAAKPATATGQCKDGTYSTAASKSGACRGHNGVKDWYTATAPTTAPPKPGTVAPPPPAPTAATTRPAPAARPAPAPAPTPSAAIAPAPASQTPAPKPTAARGPKGNLANTPAAPGGGPGLVWVNTASNVYHCPNTDFYGKTKAGAYMTEAAAKGKGARPDHGNACSR